MQPYRILLVDDDALVLQSVGEALEEQGWRVELANSGEAAITALEKAAFDLVITDLVMSGIDGIAVLQKAKNLHQGIMVLILTGYGDLRSAIAALRAKADDYLLKPCNAEEIYFRVRRSFERLEMERKVKLYESMLPICCVCKKVRDDTGHEAGTGPWLPIESFVTKRSGVAVTSTYCPHCLAQAEKDLAGG